VISVCVPTFRGGDRLRKLLFTLPEDIQLIVGDDASGEEASGTIKAAVYTRWISGGCLLEVSPTNRGVVQTMRSLIGLATGEIILQLDDDVVIPEGFFETLRSLMGLPNVGVLAWRSKGTRPGQSTDPVPGFLQPATQLASYCMAFRRDVYEAVGGYDTRFRMYCGDSDLALRVCLSGRPCYRVWWPLVPHEEHASFSERETDRLAIARADLAAFHEKWGAMGDEMEKRALAKLGET